MLLLHLCFVLEGAVPVRQIERQQVVAQEVRDRHAGHSASTRRRNSEESATEYTNVRNPAIATAAKMAP